METRLTSDELDEIQAVQTGKKPYGEKSYETWQTLMLSGETAPRRLLYLVRDDGTSVAFVGPQLGSREENWTGTRQSLPDGIRYGVDLDEDVAVRKLMAQFGDLGAHEKTPGEGEWFFYAPGR